MRPVDLDPKNAERSCAQSRRSLSGSKIPTGQWQPHKRRFDYRPRQSRCKCRSCCRSDIRKAILTAHYSTLANVPDAHKDDLEVLYLKINILDQMGNLAQAESLLRQTDRALSK